MNSNDVLIRPVISEKTTSMMEQNKYVFEVMMKANKLLVRQAIKEIFGVRAEKINMMVVRGKQKSIRFRNGRSSAWKKAVVTLKAGDKIEIFESQK